MNKKLLDKLPQLDRIEYMLKENKYLEPSIAQTTNRLVLLFSVFTIHAVLLKDYELFNTLMKLIISLLFIGLIADIIFDMIFRKKIDSKYIDKFKLKEDK